jgi:hypothetical protein
MGRRLNYVFTMVRNANYDENVVTPTVFNWVSNTLALRSKSFGDLR